MDSFNITDNVRNSHLCPSDSYVLCTLLYVFLGSLTVVTICGNLLVITSIIYFKQLHTPTNYLILSLAVSDLLIGVLILPLSMASSIDYCNYRYTLFCKLRESFDTMISIASILNLCCISIDRYYAVCKPLMYKTKITENVAVMMSLVSWTVSIVIGIVYFTLENHFDICDIYGECFIFPILLCIFTYYIPTIILFCLYFKILVVAQRQARSIQNTTSQSGPTVSKMERKATKTLTIVMGVFLMCWLPLYISFPFYLFSDAVENLIEPFNWFALSNSMFNPFIYAFFYSWFRAAFRMIISGKLFRGDFTNAKLR